MLILCPFDLYVGGLNFVFGLADPMLGVAALSTYRLEGGLGVSTRSGERVFKEAVHELGHLFGLQHCPERRCIMSFANSVAEVDMKEPSLCSSCLSRVRSRS